MVESCRDLEDGLSLQSTDVQQQVKGASHLSILCLYSRKKLTQYIAALRLWVKVSEVELRNQANVVQYDAY